MRSGLAFAIATVIVGGLMLLVFTYMAPMPRP